MFLLRIDRCGSGSILDPSSRVSAHYLGTEIDGSWWKRYKGDGYLMRGAGECWVQDGMLHVYRFMTGHPLCFPLKDLLEIKAGSSWHAGKWVGRSRVVKLLWEKDGRILSSGFLFSWDQDVSSLVVRDLRKLMDDAKKNAPGGAA